MTDSVSGAYGHETGSSAGVAKGKGKAPPPQVRKGTGKGKASQQDVQQLHSACQFDDELALKALLDRQDVPVDPQTRAARGQTPLHTAAVNGSTRVLSILLARRADVCASNSYRETPLHLAATADHAAIVNQLVAAGADLEAKDSWERTALRVALEQGSTAAAEALRAANAFEDGATASGGLPSTTSVLVDAAQRAKQQSLAEELAQRMQNRQERTAPLEVTVRGMFGQHVDRAGSNVLDAARTDGRQALSKLIEYPPDAHIVRQLLDDPTIDLCGRDMFGLSALHKFAAWDQAELTDLLLQRVDTSAVNAKGGDDGFTPLHHAISMGAAHALDALLKHPRTDRDATDSRGRTPREFLRSVEGAEDLLSMFDAQGDLLGRVL